MTVQSDHPKALKPIFTTPKPNNTIELYRGLIEVRRADKRHRAKGIINYDWLPFPRITFKVDAIGKTPSVIQGNTSPSIFILELNSEVTVKLRYNPISEELHGIINESFDIGEFEAVDRVQFHLANFRKFQGDPIEHTNGGGGERLKLETEQWRITVDDTSSSGEIFKSLNEESGYAITNVGEIQRCDESSFSIENLKDVLETLRNLFSFMCGRFCPPLLLVALDKDGNKKWQRWYTGYSPDIWSTDQNWFPEVATRGLSDITVAMFNYFADELWREVIPSAVSWLRQSQGESVTPETGIVTTQVGLELLSWAKLVEFEEVVDSDDFSKLKAENKLSLLFHTLDVPLDVPEKLANLYALCNRKKGLGNNWLRSSKVLAEIRNSIVHPRLKNRKKLEGFGDECRIEAYELSLWLFELCLLKLLNYSGVYFNRVKGEKDHVPWMNVPPIGVVNRSKKGLPVPPPRPPY